MRRFKKITQNNDAVGKGMLRGMNLKTKASFGPENHKL
jgi:hypothetical protein